MCDEDKRIYNFLKKIDFKCKQCSNCCRKEPGIVLLTKEDVNKIANALEMTIKDFIQECCRSVYRDEKVYISLNEKSNYDCIFWNNGCIIYEARPMQCKTFPFWPSVVYSQDTWNAEKKRCKGLNRKSTLSLEEKFKLYQKENNAEYMEMPEFN